MDRIDDHMNFEAKNVNGKSIIMDGSPNIGGKSNGVGPMESLLMAVAGCSSIDIVLILKKMKQDLKDIKVSVEGDKIKVEQASEYSHIRVHYDVWGDVKESKLKKAIDLSLGKYCSVSKMLEKTAEISSTYTLRD